MYKDKIMKRLVIVTLLFFTISVKAADIIPKNFVDYEGVKIQKLTRAKARYYSNLIWGNTIELFGQPSGVARLDLALNYYVLLFSDKN